MDIKPFQIFDFLEYPTFLEIVNTNSKMLPAHHTMFLEPLNNRFPVERLGPFSKLGEKIRTFMVEYGFKNPRVNRIGIITNNRKHVPFHLHPSLGNMNPILREEKGKFITPPERSFVAVYYCHNFKETKYQGVLGVKKHAEDKTGYTFPATPNSLIIHNGTFGHDADVEELHPTEKRYSCYTHWVIDE